MVVGGGVVEHLQPSDDDGAVKRGGPGRVVVSQNAVFTEIVCL